MEGLRIAGFVTGLLVILGFLTTSGHSITCYQCNSANDPRCGDEFDPYSLGHVNCSLKPPLEHLTHLEATICRKIVQKVYGKIRVVRSCGYVTDNTLKEGKTCIQRSGTHDVMIQYCSCKGDLCNGSTKHHIPVSHLLTFLVTAITLRKVAPAIL